MSYLGEMMSDIRLSQPINGVISAYEALEEAHKAREGDRQWFQYDADRRLTQLECSTTTSDSQRRRIQQQQSDINLQLVR